jgi:hypothetical protein
MAEDVWPNTRAIRRGERMAPGSRGRDSSHPTDCGKVTFSTSLLEDGTPA